MSEFQHRERRMLRGVSRFMGGVGVLILSYPSPFSSPFFFFLRDQRPDLVVISSSGKKDIGCAGPDLLGNFLSLRILPPPLSFPSLFPPHSNSRIGRVIQPTGLKKSSTMCRYKTRCGERFFPPSFPPPPLLLANARAVDDAPPAGLRK